MKQVMYFVRSIEGEMLNDFEDEENARKFAQVWQERGKIVYVTRVTTEFVALYEGPCLCGDLCCASYGPAQGNWRCPICGAWASEACEHISEDGNLKQEFHEQARKLEEEERRAEEEMAKAWEEEARLASDEKRNG